MLFRLPIILLVSSPLLAGGADLVVNTPVVGSVKMLLDFHMTNNNGGAVYNSAVLDTSALTTALATLNGVPVTDLVADWNRSINGAPGEVNTGWAIAHQSDGSLSLSILAPFGWDTWYATQQDPSNDEMSVTLGLPLSQLELNAEAGYQPFALSDVSSPSWVPGGYDAVIVRSDNELLVAPNYTGGAVAGVVGGVFVGISEDGFSTWSTSGLIYHALSPSDFFTLTSFATSHPGLDALEDTNGDGHSNFLDYAAGNDPAAPDVAEPFELGAGQLTYRVRTDAADVYAQPMYSTDLVNWVEMVDGAHHTVNSDAETGGVRTVVLDLLPEPRAFYKLVVGTSTSP